VILKVVSALAEFSFDSATRSIIIISDFEQIMLDEAGFVRVIFGFSSAGGLSSLSSFFEQEKIIMPENRA
jgi:hypothetical protein